MVLKNGRPIPGPIAKLDINSGPYVHREMRVNRKREGPSPDEDDALTRVSAGKKLTCVLLCSLAYPRGKAAILEASNLRHPTSKVSVFSARSIGYSSYPSHPPCCPASSGGCCSDRSAETQVTPTTFSLFSALLLDRIFNVRVTRGAPFPPVAKELASVLPTSVGPFFGRRSSYPTYSQD